MPNHCDNTLWVAGKPAEVKKFVEACKNPDHGKRKKVDGKYWYDDREWRIFEGNFPCPRELRETDAAFFTDKDEMAAQRKIERANIRKHGARHWHQWCCDNWGTKWGDYDTYFGGQDRHGATFTFNTAWSPGSEGLTQISAIWPELAFVNAYEEPGCDFIGCDAFYRGKKIYSGYCGFPEGPEDWDDPDLDPEPHYEKIDRIRRKWTRNAVAKLAKKSAFHGKKMKAMV